MRWRFWIFIGLGVLLSGSAPSGDVPKRPRRAKRGRFPGCSCSSRSTCTGKSDADQSVSRGKEYSERLAEAPRARRRDRQEALGDSVRSSPTRRHGLQAPRHARRAPSVPGFRARPPDCGRWNALTSPCPAFRVRRDRALRRLPRVRRATSRSASAPRAEHRSHLKFLESMDRINRAHAGKPRISADAERRPLRTLDIFACDARG
jgi:hypothetical protein